jgi:hypothetical protein
VLGVFSDAAREKENDVGRLGARGLPVAGPVEEPADDFGIMAIHLAAERDYMREFIFRIFDHKVLLERQNLGCN